MCIKLLQKWGGICSCLNLPLGVGNFCGVRTFTCGYSMTGGFHFRMEKILADYPMERKIPPYPTQLKFYLNLHGFGE